MNLRKSLDTCLDMKKLCSHIFSENGGGGSRNREKKRKLIERRWPKTFHKFWIIHGMVQHILFCTYMSTFKKNLLLPCFMIIIYLTGLWKINPLDILA